MNQQRGVLILAVVMGIVAIILVNTYASRVRQESEQSKGEMAVVLTVTKDVPAGSTISGEMIRQSQVPKKWQSPYSLGPEDREMVLGMRTALALKPDQQLTWGDLERREDRFSRLSDAIKPGERAITIPVDMNSGVAGLLHPNDHVDVIATFAVPGEIETGFDEDAKAQSARRMGVDIPRYALKNVTVTLLQNVTVLATGKITGAEDGPASGQTFDAGREKARYQNVTLLVTPHEAEILAYTIRKGEFTLALRSAEDTEILESFDKVVFTDLVEPDKRKVIQQQHNTIQKKRLESLPPVIYGRNDKRPN